MPKQIKKGIPLTALTVLLSLLLLLVTACGTNSATTSATNPPGESLYVLDGYAQSGNTNTGGQQIVAFQSGSAHPSKQMTLPAGLTSLDHQKLYTVRANNGRTTITVLNTQTGAQIRSLTIPGTYSTTGEYFTAAALSYDGHWLALRQVNQAGNGTTIALIDAQAGRLAQTIRLSGGFDVDAVSPDGSRLYLLERRNDGTGHYYVRLYEVQKQLLDEGYIVDKTIPNDIMTGSALTRQVARDGSMVYTLYVDTVHNIAFVHILPLAGDYLGARCIDLPVGKSTDQLRYYTLMLSADGNLLYAANGALGVVSKIDVSNGDQVFSDTMQATARFNPGEVALSGSDRTRLLYNGAALSPDQKTLYFAGVRGIWAVDTKKIDAAHNSAVQSNYLAQQAFTGVALSSDGQTLYAIDPTKGITLLDRSTGQTRQVIQGPARAPWGIEWIAN